MKLLQSLGRSGQFNEANEEANKNLISKKACFLLSLLCLILPYVQAKKNATSSFSAQVRKSTSSRKGEFHDSPTESTFPVAQVALFFVGLELDDDDFLDLAHSVKYNENAFICLRKLGLYKAAQAKSDLTFSQAMDTQQIEERLVEVLGAPMEYLTQLGREEGTRQWRLLKVEGKGLKLLDEDSPDGGTLYKARGALGKAWTLHSVIIISVQPLPAHVMRSKCPDWERYAKRFLREIGWHDIDFDSLYPSSGKKRAHSPASDDESSEDESTSQAPPPRKKSQRLSAKKDVSPPVFDIAWHDNDVEEAGAVEVDNTSGDDYGSPRPSSPILASVPTNVWDLNRKLEYFTTD
ncbi:uncharacterized protein C8R40DRAFT_1066005 [Lentinula edodes]|uniref:uncharacterized protein n=1 Tax=Lentinula edodes TaxID=5353 RepID=UPI001BF3B734|nr:uncharacterized protein C8R40DRAFT_1168062 [Lentinula edodes]XP_046090910.1 uncharacterized protein C8R40DRAFT_1066005 [Lentinula edodes]KAF8829959.1 hypothetical protein HHX47_DHR2000263 [Lentinula edodes]KAH7878012.1 hypothetical protein C8R40DRAFT_1168062 [Lentinula edodes]KAH7879816.1 hypothetical protein C8R40DRAFT_1066005 [Lentinula edodes]KAJ3911714.1 hypothetical protein F5877DRAFT_85614 [Lentinula edodes]